MKKLFFACLRMPRLATLLAMVAGAVIVPATLLAWGPASRPTYTTAEPFGYNKADQNEKGNVDHVVFNSITDNPRHGDELNFVQIKEADASNSTYKSAYKDDPITLTPGKTYQVFVYYHNDTSSTYNDKAHDYSGIAHDAHVRAQMPAVAHKGKNARISAFVGASNAQPKEVWDEVYGKASTDMALRYVQGSATIHNNGKTNGSTLPDSIISDGVKIGFDKLDGTLPGCNHYSGYVTFKFKAVAPNFEVAKMVSKHGQNDYKKSISVNPGDEVDYKLEYKNTGGVEQDNVVIKDTLPKGVSYVDDSTYIANSVTNGKWSLVKSNDLVTKKGINIGAYKAHGGNAYLKFTAKVTGDNLECGKNTLTNTVRAETDNGSKEDTADVVVEKDCEKPEKIKVCDLSTNEIVTIDKDEYDSSKYSKDLSDCEKPEQIQVCDLDTNEIVTIDKDEYDSSKYSKDLSDCEKPETGTIVVCDLDSGKTVSIDKSDFDSSKYSKDLEECVETPTELPHTGVDGLSAIVGLVAIVTSAGYYIASRRGLGL